MRKPLIYLQWIKKDSQIVFFCYAMFLLTCISSCASFYDINVAKAPLYQPPLVVATNYAISGRFSINSNTRHDYGNFVWNKNADHEEINFNTPLGQTVAKIVIESGIPILSTKGHVYIGDDLDDMIYHHLGFTLPLKYLHYWVQGIPLPNTPVLKQLYDGFVQSGWSVEYLEWQDRNHPHILKCTKGDLVVKLLINWE